MDGEGLLSCVQYWRGLPIVGAVLFSQKHLGHELFYTTALHEIGHALRFGTIWKDHGQIGGYQSPYFRGENARAAFNSVGGDRFTGSKVPAEVPPHEGHWRESVFGDELMTHFVITSDQEPLSLVTVQSLADLGYEVDAGQAEPYTLPTAASKPVASVGLRCRAIQIGAEQL